MTINCKAVYKVRNQGLNTDSLSNLQVRYRQDSDRKAKEVHEKYTDFLKKEIGHECFEVTNIACMADGIIGHVYVGSGPKNSGNRKCFFCGLDDFDL